MAEEKKVGWNMVTDYITNLTLDLLKSHVEQKVDEKQIKERLATYLENQKKYNELCEKAEECDFQGLMGYLSEELMDEMKTRVFSINGKERETARREITNKAMAYSKAETAEAKARVRNVVMTSIDLIREFYGKEISMKDYLLAAKIIDEEKIEHDKTRQMLDKIQNMNSVAVFGEYIEKLLKEGKIEQANNLIQKQLEAMSVDHPQYPAYGYTLDKGKVISWPRNQEAMIQYPPKYELKAT